MFKKLNFRNKKYILRVKPQQIKNKYIQVPNKRTKNGDVKQNNA